MNEQLFMVRCIGNFFGGKYYETGMDSIFVAATSKEEAVELANNSIDAVVEHFHNKRVSGASHALRRKDNRVRITGDAKPVPNQKQYNKALLRDGTFGPWSAEQPNQFESLKSMTFVDFLVEMGNETTVDLDDPQAMQKMRKAQQAHKTPSQNDDKMLWRKQAQELQQQLAGATGNELRVIRGRIQQLKDKMAGRAPKENQMQESIQLDEGLIQDVFNYLWYASGNILDRLPVIGEKRAEQKLIKKFDEFNERMTDERTEEWINELSAQLRSSHHSTVKASTQRLEQVRKSIYRVKNSSSSKAFVRNMEELNSTLRMYNQFAKGSNEHQMDRKRAERAAKRETKLAAQQNQDQFL